MLGEVVSPSEPEPEFLEGRSSTDLRSGDTASLVHVVTDQDVQVFAAVTGNVNPTHLDARFASRAPPHAVVAHAMLGASLISTVLGTRLPGPGTVYLDQTLKFLEPVLVNDALTVTVTVMSVDTSRQTVHFFTSGTNQRGEAVFQGQATVAAPLEKQRVRRAEVAEPLQVHHGRLRYGALLDAAAPFGRIRMGMLDATSLPVLHAAMEAVRLGLIEAVLIGPEARIRALALDACIDLGPVRIVDAEAGAIVRKAVTLVGAGELDCLAIDETGRADVATALATPSQWRPSHVAVLDVPCFERPLLVTDSEIHVSPDLATKATIVTNAIELAQALGIATPNIALLSASDDPRADLRSSNDANALLAMARNRMITGGTLEGPMTLATALQARAGTGQLSEAAAKAGPDVFVVPDIEAGRMLIDSLVHLGAAAGAGLLIGGKVPVVLTRVTDSMHARVAGHAIALLFLEHRRFRTKRNEAHADAHSETHAPALALAAPCR